MCFCRHQQVFCPPIHEGEPLLHMSAVRRLQMHGDTFVFRYAAIRLLEIDVSFPAVSCKFLKTPHLTVIFYSMHRFFSTE